MSTAPRLADVTGPSSSSAGSGGFVCSGSPGPPASNRPAGRLEAGGPGRRVPVQTNLPDTTLRAGGLRAPSLASHQAVGLFSYHVTVHLCADLVKGLGRSIIYRM